ncbi:hypothetical protein [Streptomyces sp. NPDC093097]|uniref:hypothetical protein n=1 Tax=Streptomyces sp. NPDC093097 TaxID=3366027 RepID=UPI003818DC86
MKRVGRLAPLAGEWLQRGATVRDIREALTSGLPETVHCPAALMRDRLVRKMPDAPSCTEQRAIGTPSVPRAAAMRECAGEHLQPLLFRPVDDERLGAVCRNEQAETTAADAGVPSQMIWSLVMPATYSDQKN